MDQTRFDRLTRHIGRTASRRAAIAAAIAAIAGGVVAPDPDAAAVVCTARGGSCARRACCAGLTCDARKKTCLGTTGSACQTTSHCASGLNCRRGKCEGTAVCRSITKSCTPGAGGCCANLVCNSARRACVGLLGAGGCGSDADCVAGLTCRSGICSEPPPPDPCPLAEVAEYCILFADYSRADLCGPSTSSPNNADTGTLCYANSDCQTNCDDATCKCQIGWNEGGGLLYLADEFPDLYPNAGGYCVSYLSSVCG